MPLHQRAAVADDRGVVDGDPVGDVHRRHERALVAVDAIDERLRRGGIEELVVADVGVVDVVLVPGRGVPDRLEAERSHRGHIGEARQVLLRAPDQRGGAELLGPGHAGDARHVDRLARVVRPRPVQTGGEPGGVGGRAVVGRGVAVPIGGVGRQRRGVVVGVPGGLAVTMVVGGTEQHRHDDERSDRPRRHAEVDGGHRRAPADHRGERGDDGDRAERGTDGVGERRRLRVLEAADPRDVEQPGRRPRTDGDAVDHERERGGESSTAHQREQADGDLGDGAGDEEAGERDVVGVDSDGAGVDDAGADRCQSGELHDADADRERPLWILTCGRGWWRQLGDRLGRCVAHSFVPRWVPCSPGRASRGPIEHRGYRP